MDMTQSTIFNKLKQACSDLQTTPTTQLFATENNRFANFSRRFDQLLLDFSKQKITQEVFDLLLALAEELNLRQAIQALSKGEIVNHSENRPAKHMHVRAPQPTSDIEDERRKMQEFIVNNTFEQVIHIGIGGSDLGPQMVVQALQPFALENAPKIHFISNTDGDHLSAILSAANPHKCLCIISSKSFTTLETLTLATKVIAWYAQSLAPDKIAQHLIAITANPAKAIEFGLKENNIFKFWDFVGGRYSIWSAIGLPLALTIGYEQFMQFLNGAHALDQHFIDAPLADNLPVILALIGILNINFYNYQTHCVMPYTDALQLFPSYLQQLEMESNGKQAKFNTAPVVWGSVGCNGQHAYMQLLHQGTIIAPIDFILPTKAPHGDHELQNVLISSCLAQSRALLTGSSAVTYQHCPGDKPSTTIICEQLTPYTLGQLIALYEQKVFAQAIIWGLNPFDQWGVQLGKIINEQLLAIIQQPKFSADSLDKLDSSTKGLLQIIYSEKVN